MKNFFEHNDVDTCPLIEYVDSFINENSSNFNFIQLPPIQRNSVWNVAQIERLWDSLLRGFPIGSFLVSPRHKEDKARDLYSGMQIESLHDGYFLLDGQQRTRALLLGFKPNENARLWIDLNPNLMFENIELNDRKFLLRVLTNYQPWGMSDRNPSDKISENQKFHARGELKVEQLHYDYEIKIDIGQNEDNSNRYSWPVKAELPVPLDALINLCGGTSGKFIKPTWQEVSKLIPNRYQSAGQILQEPIESLHVIINSIKSIIERQSELSKVRTVVLLLNNKTEVSQVENIQDDMEVLFRRINAGGTILQGEEMAYSLLKSIWDGSYEMVSAIIKDKTIGYLLPSTGIVMTATRMARFIQNENDVPNPGIGNFRKWIGEAQPDSFLEIMQTLLNIDISGKSQLHQTIEAFCKLALYREDVTNDIGLPKKLLLSIRPAIYHPVLIWIHRNLINEEILEGSRMNILRYLMYSFLTIEKYDHASKLAIELLKTNEYEMFPDKIIYEKYLDEEITVPIPTPQQFNAPFELPADGFLRHWNDLFDVPGDTFNTFRSWFWKGPRELLLWFQREFVSKWFKGYDPTSIDSFDTPYDWDHIVPYSHLITSGSMAQTYSEEVVLNKKFYDNRHLFINSLGNYRLWPYWANRSDNNRCHTYKLRMEEPNWENDDVAKELGLFSVNDFLNASIIPPEDEHLWYNAGGDPREWPIERRLAWQQAVERRVCYLYKTLYISFNLQVLSP